jgi:hypothetical protein
MPVMRFAFALLLGGLALGGGTNTSAALMQQPSNGSSQTQADPNPQSKSAGSSVNAVLQECDRANVSVAATNFTFPAIDRATAERAVGIIGARGSAAVAVPALVTSGETWGVAPAPGSIQKDSRGQPVLSRPAWALVFRHQSIQRPSAGPARHKSSLQPLPRQLAPVTIVAAIVDAQTGEFLMGWGCDG